MIQEVKIKSIASPLFTGRSEILNEFEQRFCERARGSSPRRLLRIWGMGGVGKTQIALQFRDLYGSRYVYKLRQPLTPIFTCLSSVRLTHHADLAEYSGFKPLPWTPYSRVSES